jgi:hypothetical protein
MSARGVVKPVEQLDNAELIAEFVKWAKQARLTQASAAEAVGVSQATTSEWWRKIYRELQPDTRRAVEVFVREKRGEGSVPNEAAAAAHQEALLGEGSRELWRQLDRIEAQANLTETMKILKVQEIAAAIRAEAMREAEGAAKIRAEAILEAERGTRQRSEAIKEEAQSAGARTLALRGEGPGTVSGAPRMPLRTPGEQPAAPKKGVA